MAKSEFTCPVCGSHKAACPSVKAACQHLGCWLLEKAMRADPELRARLEPQVLHFRGGVPIDKGSIRQLWD